MAKNNWDNVHRVDRLIRWSRNQLRPLETPVITPEEYHRDQERFDAIRRRVRSRKF